jgi:hypothetical protein
MGDEVRLEENFFQWTITITSFTGRSLGVTKMRGFLHPDQNVRKATQNSLCRAVNRRRGCCACRASNCRRRARFSRTRSSRERKTLTNQPRKCRTDTIMARILAEKSESSFSQVIHSAGVRRFGEAQGSGGGLKWQTWQTFAIPKSRLSCLESGGREGIRTPGLLVANEEKSKLRCGTTIT